LAKKENGEKKGILLSAKGSGTFWGKGQRVQCTMVQNWAAKIVGIQLGPNI
jgi:hypothetical protein